MEIRSLSEAEPFTTKDGSTIRELLGLPTSSARNQSLAEATLPPGGATQRHHHRETEEIYYVVEGSGEMEIDGERARVAPGDAVLIPPAPGTRSVPIPRVSCASCAAAPRPTVTRTRSSPEPPAVRTA